MGCDIHAHIEIKGPDNKWHKADSFVPNLFEKGKFVRDTELPIDRNYELFSLLVMMCRKPPRFNAGI